MAKLKKSHIISFWAKVQVKKSNECWPWLASTKRGYGQFSARYSTKIQHNIPAHKIAYALAKTNHQDPRLLEGLVLHSCDNPLCCNPKHLRLGTHQDNTDDMKARGRANFWGGGGKVRLDYTQVDNLLAKGLSAVDIAKATGISETSVKRRRSKIEKGVYK